MKTFMSLMVLAAFAAQGAVVGGPNGGRLLDGLSPRAEFLINAENRIELRFYDEESNPVLPTDQVVKIVAETASGRVSLNMEKRSDRLVSESALPDGDGYTIVVLFKENPDARNKVFRIPFHRETCGGCGRAEYACTCGHGEEDEHGHEH